MCSFLCLGGIPALNSLGFELFVEVFSAEVSVSFA